MKSDLVEPIERVTYRDSTVESVDATLKAWIQKQGWSCQVWEDPPGAYHSPHDHSYSHRVLLEVGRMDFTVESTTYRLESGDTLDLPRRVTHEARAHPEQASRYWLLRGPGD